LGASLDALALDDLDMTPLALATLCHYPDILADCLDHHQQEGLVPRLITPGGKSLLIPAIEGGSIHKMTIGRVTRHGDCWKLRAIETLVVLLVNGASAHLADLPGEPGVSALFFAATWQPHIIEFLVRNGALPDINRRCVDTADVSDEEMMRPPLHQAILWGKTANALKLLELGADVQLGENEHLPTSALYQCAISSVQDHKLVEELCRKGLGVDDGPPDYETPFALAVRNGCYELAAILRCKGASPNALYSEGYCWKSRNRHTLLFTLLRNNNPASISRLKFLLDRASGSEVAVMVEPERNHTAFHALAIMDGDSLDGDTASKALQCCDEYFDPDSAVLNVQSVPRLVPAAESGLEDEGGNTALHYAITSANFEVTEYLLAHGADPLLKNAMGMTPLDIAALIYPDFASRFEPRDIPRCARRQLDSAKRRRDAIMKRLSAATNVV